MNADEVWAVVAAQRRGLADLLDGQPPAAWRVPSLCAGWLVEDVVAHLTLGPRVTPAFMVRELVRARGRYHRMVTETARRAAARGPAHLLDELRATADSHRRVPGTDHRVALLDVLVHGQDIAIPLGLDHAMPTQAAVVAAAKVWSMGFPFHAARRFTGIRFVATDATFAVGRGAPVEGRAGALLLTLTGRPALLDQLTGPGRELLRTRLRPD